MDARPLRLTDRLRGIYTVPVNDGAGLLNGKDTFTPAEPFFTPPVQKEAADRIEHLESVLWQAQAALDPLSGFLRKDLERLREEIREALK